MTECIETWRNLPEVKTVPGNLARTRSAAPDLPAHVEHSRVWEQNPPVAPVWLSPRWTRFNLTKSTFYSVSYLWVEEAACGLLESLRWDAYTCLILSFEINFYVYVCVCVCPCPLARGLQSEGNVHESALTYHILWVLRLRSEFLSSQSQMRLQPHYWNEMTRIHWGN